jgi:hypothetical protein
MNVSNKLFCTFIEEPQIDEFINEIKFHYTIAYNKVFVLRINVNNEYVCTYNIVEPQVEEIPINTILVHRKKESNTLYTINALNELIKKLNNGIVDTNYKINWNHYKNTILLTQHDELKFLKTKIYKIVNI